MNAKHEIDVNLIIQGRKVTSNSIGQIKKLITFNPFWNRTRLSKELCLLWDWRRATGELKDIACRSLLRKLEKLGYIQLPKAIQSNGNSSRRYSVQPILHSKEPIIAPFKSLYPLDIQLIEKGYQLKLFKYFISAYHYLGWSGTVGENLKYLFFDCHERPLGCLMFGAAAWKVMARDKYIGWEPDVRKRNLLYIANNNRYLLLPWVSVGHLASHILGRVARRINQDWLKKYNHPIYLLETFVEKDRFKGTCYKAANWVHVGATQGRGKLDVKKQYLLPIKDIWVYPLEASFREKLCV
ncbi:MAG: Druantia anti-phage system protein DruA [Planctomycetota bacterium]|jgi:hypothetical protein